MTPKTTKRLFLVDAMGYIFRAFFAPMDRLQTSTGIPTKVPYLFATMMRRLMQSKDLRPDYLAVVFDVAAPTFRDKLFAEYKAQRPPMPDDLAIQIPFVRRYCEAMRLSILEYPGYEADDVIGALARQATKEDLDVLIVTSDKDLMQLVGGRVRVLNPAKSDLIIDEKKVEEIMGVPPSKVADVMALMGDSIDNIPGRARSQRKARSGRAAQSRHRRSWRAKADPTVRQRRSGSGARRRSEAARAIARRSKRTASSCVSASSSPRSPPTPRSRCPSMRCGCRSLMPLRCARCMPSSASRLC